MREAVIVASVRTAVGKANKGVFKDVRPEDLAAEVIKGAIDKVPGLKGEDIEDVVMGCAMPEGQQGLNIARTVALHAGLPVSVPGQTVNRFCASGLQAIAQSAERIIAGGAEVLLAGGVESMTAVPMGGHTPRPHPGIVANAPAIYTGMGNTAEIVATRYEISREKQDAFAAESHRRSLAAIAEGKFKDEIIPVNGVDTDEGPRAGSTAEVLGKLRAVFAASGGSVTAGNSSQMSDGAAATIVMSREKAEALGAEILGVFRGFVVTGCEPDEMGIGPSHAIPALLEKTGLKLEDIDLFELNEAFASQSVYVVEKLGLDTSKVNVNGGAISLGHPLGCTGAKLTATLLHELKRRGGRYGIVTMCIGGGMGAAGLFERPQ